MSMIASLSFQASPLIFAAALIAFLQPLYLWFTALMPRMAGRNPVQFLVSVIIEVFLFGILVTIFSASIVWQDVLISGLIIFCGILFYLEVWALLSRGYTLGLLLTLLDAEPEVLTKDVLAANYRGGDGIDWIMHHRLLALTETRLVVQKGDQLRLTTFPGLPAVWLYKMAIAFLGLRGTG